MVVVDGGSERDCQAWASDLPHHEWVLRGSVASQPSSSFGVKVSADLLTCEHPTSDSAFYSSESAESPKGSPSVLLLPCWIRQGLIGCAGFWSRVTELLDLVGRVFTGGDTLSHPDGHLRRSGFGERQWQKQGCFSWGGGQVWVGSTWSGFAVGALGENTDSCSGFSRPRKEEKEKVLLESKQL